MYVVVVVVPTSLVAGPARKPPPPLLKDRPRPLFPAAAAAAAAVSFSSLYPSNAPPSHSLRSLVLLLLVVLVLVSSLLLKCELNAFSLHSERERGGQRVSPRGCRRRQQGFRLRRRRWPTPRCLCRCTAARATDRPAAAGRALARYVHIQYVRWMWDSRISSGIDFPDGAHAPRRVDSMYSIDGLSLSRWISFLTTNNAAAAVITSPASLLSFPPPSRFMTLAYSFAASLAAGRADGRTNTMRTALVGQCERTPILVRVL